MIEKFTESKWNSDRLAVFAAFMFVFLGNEPLSLGITPDGMRDFMYLCFGLIGFKTLRGTATGGMIEVVLDKVMTAVGKEGKPIEELEAPAEADNDESEPAPAGQSDR